jgi:hypothetical protein
MNPWLSTTLPFCMIGHVDAGTALGVDQLDSLRHGVGIFAAVLQRLEAQAGRHLRKSMGERHIVSKFFAVANARACVVAVAGERRHLVEELAELSEDFSQVHDVFLDDPLSLRFAGSFARAKLVVGWFARILFRVRPSRISL